MIICRCEEVMLHTIQQCIENTGASTSKEVKLCTRAGMGICQGRTCGLLIERLLAQSGALDVPPLASKHNVPVRPLLLGELSGRCTERGGGR